MKKSLSLILSIALVFSMFSSLAFAADQSIGEKLKAAGVISGNSSGDLMEDQIWKREDLTVLAAKLLGVVEEAQAAGDTHDFDDVDNPYYDGFISYAKENGIFVGVSETSFGMNRGITAKQFAAVILRLLGFEFDYDTETEALAIEHGIFAEGTNWLQPAKRGDLYSALAAGIQVVGADGQTIAEKRNYVGFYEVSAEQKISSFKAVSTNKLEVKFAAAVDADKAKFTVKRGTIATNIKGISYSDDKKTATIETVSRMIAGDYNLTVSGLTEKDLTASTNVKDETITSIEFTSDVAPLYRNNTKAIYTWVKVTNQYGEDITSGSLANGISFNASKGNDARIVDGVLKITHTGPTQPDYMINEKVSVTAAHANSGKFASAIVTVSQSASVSKIDIKGLRAENDATLNVSAKPSDLWLEVEATDQYNNKVPASEIGSDVMVSVNTYVLNVKRDVYGPKFDQIKSGVNGIYLADADNTGSQTEKFRQGSVTVMLMSKTTGNSDSITLEVVDTPKVDTLSIAAAEIAVAGEKPVLEFEAVDQFGNEMTNPVAVINGLQGKAIHSTLGTVKEHEGKLVLDLETDPSIKNNITFATPIYITAFTSTGKSVQYSMVVNPKKEAQVVSGVDVAAAFGQNAEVTINNEKIYLDDQYGRQHDAKAFGYNVTSFTVTPSGDTVTYATYGATSGTFTAVGNKTGNTTFNVSLNGVPGSDFSVTIRTVAPNEIASYEVQEMPVLYGGTDRVAGHSEKKLVVNGLLDNGDKVVLPVNHSDFYEVVSVNSKVAYTKASRTLVATGHSGDDIKVNVIVSGKTKDGLQVNPIEVTVSAAPPAPATFAAKVDGGGDWITINKGDADDAHLTNADLKDLAKNLINVTDQYGVGYTVTTNTGNPTTDDILQVYSNYSGEADKAFNLLVVYNNGAVFNLNVWVE